MAREVKKRSYASTLRAEQAAQTRGRVLRAAHELFSEQGYAATSVADIAAAAGVNVDTVYAAVGRKPQLLLAVIDMALASSDDPLPPDERDYVRAIRAATTARDKFAVYTAALSRVMPVVAPLFQALAQAALSDPVCAQAHDELVERRAANMRALAADLRATGELRPDLTDERVADIIWSTNAPEYFVLLRSRGWSARQYAAHLDDVWTRVLLVPVESRE